MSAPSSDQAAIRQTLRILKLADVKLDLVDNGEEDVDVSTATEQETIDTIMEVDDAHLFVTMPEGWTPRRSFIRFVMGNDPEEVICDHGVSLSPILDPLMKSWGN